jgi:glyoxylate reductase
MKKIFITREIPDAGINLLRQEKFKVEIFKKDKPISQKQLIENIKDADAVISLLTDKFDRDVLDKMEKCKIIANYAVGHNNIDVEYARTKNIIITNTPDVLTHATADLAIGLTLACSRKIIDGHIFMSDKKFKGWKPKLLLGIELKDKVFGILGAGRIGTATAIRAKAFGTKIVYYSRSKNEDLEKQTGAEKTSLDDLLINSDFISIHLPLNQKTNHLLDKSKLKLLKKTAILINTARGEIVDEKELIKILKKKRIFSAGFDVYEGEPKINSSLYKLDNVVLLPHIGSATFETRDNMSILAAKNVIAVLSGQKALTPV